MTPIIPDKAIVLLEKELTSVMIGGFYEVYNGLGYGFLETNYRNALALEYQARGLSVAREVGIAVRYKGHVVGRYRADMIVEGKVLVEVKCSAALSPPDHKQVANYLRATGVPIALLFHFGPKPEFHRSILSNTQQSPSKSAAPESSESSE